MSKSPDISDLTSMLLSGYKRGGQATRLEPVGDTFRTVAFDVFGPKALACIAGLPPALASRCIRLMMFRAAPGSEKPRRRIDVDPVTWQRLRDDLHRLALEHGSTWLELSQDANVCPRMSGRDYELWQPLLALASWIDADGARGLLDLMQNHALTTIDRGKDEATPDADVTLLSILAESVRLGERVTPHEVLEKAAGADLSGAFLSRADLSKASLSGADQLQACHVANARSCFVCRSWSIDMPTLVCTTYREHWTPCQAICRRIMSQRGRPIRCEQPGPMKTCQQIASRCAAKCGKTWRD